MYLSNIQVKTNEEWNTVSLSDNQWQNRGTGLIGQYCRDSNDKNWQLAIGVTKGKVQAFRFSIAVPFPENHQNPLTAEKIFDNSNMFWTWQQGYKSLRLDLSNDTDAWAYHIGAIGCKSPSVMRAPTHECRQTNNVDVVIDNIDFHAPIIIDISKIISGISLGDQSRCLSMPTQHVCHKLMDNMNSSSSPVFYQRGANVQ